MDIEIGPNVRKLKSMKQNVKQHTHNLTKSYPQMDLLFLCLVIGAVQEINAQQSGQSGKRSTLENLKITLKCKLLSTFGMIIA